MKTADKVLRATAKAVVAAQQRDAVIREAHSGGMTIRAIAAASGLSSARVHQIIHSR